jgi:molybdopterin-binding protein
MPPIGVLVARSDRVHSRPRTDRAEPGALVAQAFAAHCRAFGHRSSAFATVPGSAAMKISARNVFTGKVVDVKTGAVAAQVKVDIGGGNVITSMITADSVEELGIKEGDDIDVVIKSSEVMLAK